MQAAKVDELEQAKLSPRCQASVGTYLFDLDGCRTGARQNCTCEAEWFENLPSTVCKNSEQDVNRA
jgi:hypothetical protein